LNQIQQISKPEMYMAYKLVCKYNLYKKLGIISISMSYKRGADSRPKPVETGKEYDVEITELSRMGDGIARVQGFVIFVKGAKAGQKAKIQITSIGERFAKAELV
jgi:predicted RNA-binding protein with TRAM domain